MASEITTKEMSSWLSTYGILTAERILERFNIHLKHDELNKAIKDSDNFYYQLLRVPLKNIFNGIILAQAADYRGYAQKLFIDYLVSGAGIENADSPGAGTREEIEQARLDLIALGETFETQIYNHQKLIAESQAALIQLSKHLPPSPTTEYQREIEQTMSLFVEQAENMNILMRDFRQQFYNQILKVTELMGLLSDYRPDEEKQLQNRALLDFNKAIGE